MSHHDDHGDEECEDEGEVRDDCEDEEGEDEEDDFEDEEGDDEGDEEKQEGLRVGDAVGDATVMQVAEECDRGAALLSDGRVLSWDDACDDEDDEPPADLGPAVQVDVSIDHTVVLLADGRVVCWGSNDDGQCDVPSDLGPAVRVFAGEDFFSDSEYTRRYTAALQTDGRTRLWGEGLCDGLPWEVAGEHAVELLLSSGSALSQDFGDTLLASVTSGVVKQVAAGESHTAAVLADGRVACWGENGYGQCDVPEAIQGRVARVHAEGRSTWAVDIDDRLHGWGFVKEVDSLPFELSDEAWLEFATRMWGKTKQTIYPEHVRKSAAFNAIHAMHKLSEE